jgi:hypothetical protein
MKSVVTIRMPEHARRAVAKVKAEMSNDDLRALAAGDGRLFTTLICERECLRDPLVAALDLAGRMLSAAGEARRQAFQTGDEVAMEIATADMEEARQQLEQALDEFERRELRNCFQRKRDLPASGKPTGAQVLAFHRRKSQSGL